MTNNATFKGLLLRETESSVSGAIEDLDDTQLSAGDVTIGVEYSTVNYKDGLIVNGQGRLVRQYPHIPGIDIAGTVLSSQSLAFREGQKVLCTGWRVGEIHSGGYAQRARLKSEWLVPLPDGLDTKRAMAIGTAGFTAMQSVIALEQHGLRPGNGEVLVTGASGGVGSVAVAILAQVGHDVVASTGKLQQTDYLKSLGARSVVDRKEFSDPPKRPLGSERWAAAIDSVGSTTLATVLTGVRYGGSVAACGLAAGNDLPTTVLPFILRGVNLLGIDSVMCPMTLRKEIWRRLVKDLPMAKLDAATEVIPLGEVMAAGGRILRGEVRGRLVVDVNA